MVAGWTVKRYCEPSSQILNLIRLERQSEVAEMLPASYDAGLCFMDPAIAELGTV